MNCYDHGTQGEVVAAVATCANCGAAICAVHSRVEEKRLDQNGVGNPVHASTRNLLCVSCDRVLAPQGLEDLGDQRPAFAG